MGGLMPVAVVQEWAEGGSDTTNYDAVHEKLMAADTMPDGFLVHAAGATPDGGFRVFEVWESAAQFQAFVEERLVSILKEIGLQGREPTVTTYELHEYVVR
jgi:hypothetical protein